MITISLNSKEKEILEQTLSASLDRLHDEIHHTDSTEYRDRLKERKEVLKKIQEQLQ